MNERMNFDHSAREKFRAIVDAVYLADLYFNEDAVEKVLVREFGMCNNKMMEFWLSQARNANRKQGGP